MTQDRTPPTVSESHNDPSAGEVFVLGGDAIGDALARRLHAADRQVTFIDESASSADVPAHRADPTDVQALEAAGLSASSIVIAATASDSRNFLIAQLARARFGVERVLVLVNDPDREPVMLDSGHEPVSATTALAETLMDRL